MLGLHEIDSHLQRGQQAARLRLSGAGTIERSAVIHRGANER
jgi:hypothetical protein